MLVLRVCVRVFAVRVPCLCLDLRPQALSQVFVSRRCASRKLRKMQDAKLFVYSSLNTLKENLKSAARASQGGGPPAAVSTLRVRTTVHRVRICCYHLRNISNLTVIEGPFL